MKTMTIFKCELCGSTYDNAFECEACEKSHIKPVKIISSNAQGGLFDYYPDYVVIEFDNGAIRRYYWDRLG